MFQRILMLAVAVAIGFGALSAKTEAPDFNFPADVTKQAEADLKRALQSDDGQLLIDAIVRASVAQSLISIEMATPIIERIEATLKKENRPAYRALLHYYHARVLWAYHKKFTPYDRNVAFDDEALKEVKDPYAHWGREQFRNAIDSLVRLSIADSTALMQIPSKDFPRIIKGNDLGFKYVPTLYQFMLLQGIELTSSNSLENELYGRWVGSTADLSLISHLFARIEKIKDDTYSGSRRDEECYKLFQQYPTAEESGLTLSNISGDKYYKTLQSYVARCPNSIYTPEITNTISNIERTNISVSYDGHATSRDSVRVTLSMRNVNDYDLRVYRLPDSLANDQWRRLPAYELNTLQLIGITRHSVAGTVPFETRDTVVLPPMDYGRYVIMPVYNDRGKEVIPAMLRRGKTLSIYDIASFSVSETGPRLMKKGDPDPQDDNRIVVVDAVTGAPVQGVTVSSVNPDRPWSAVSDAEGVVPIPHNMGYSTLTYNLSRGNDRYGPSASFYRSSEGNIVNNGVNIFTDLSIYRPGEQIKWALIAYRQMVESRSVLANIELTVEFLDANNKVIATTEVTTDEFGRAEGTFDVPTDRLLGRYGIRATSKAKDIYRWEYINVSEYKTPTFYVDMPSDELSFLPGEPITVSGKALTYTGLPVANAEVKLVLKKQEWFWHRYRFGGHELTTNLADTIVSTDADGRFSVGFAADKFPENNNRRYCIYRYTAEAQVTNATGESQTASGYFHIGSKRELRLADPITHINTEPLRLPLTYNTTDEDSSAVRVVYKLLDRHYHAIDSGIIMSDNPVVDFTRIPSGEYSIRVNIEGYDDYSDHSTDRSTLFLYRTTDGAAPVADVPLWIPEGGYYIDNNNLAHVSIGTSTPQAHIYYVAYGRKNVLARGWIKAKSGFREFTIPVPDKADEVMRIQFMSVSRTNYYTREITMVSPRNRTEMKVRATSFRDMLTPGKRERWTFTLCDAHDAPQRGAFMLSMIDKAINDLSDNTWRFGPSLLGCNPISMYTMDIPSRAGNDCSNRAASLSTRKSAYKLPEFIEYDYSLWEACRSPYERFEVYESRALGASAVREKAAPMVMNAGAAADSYELSDEAAVAEEEPEVDQAALDNVVLRLADIKTALWQPMLTSDANGTVNLEFDVPNFNTTWLLQTIAYTNSLAASTEQRQVVTRKPLMVRSSLPRFVRHGDAVRLAANVQNATEQATAYDAVIEIFDPRSGSIYATRTFKGNLEPQASAPLTAEWNVPDTLAFVGFRVKAANADFGDGEQVMLPVLAAVSPIIETQPFFIDTGHTAFDYTMPDVPDNARVTVEYCDNPVWFCVTALPSIFSDNTTVSSSLAHSLFALNVARGIANSQPIIAEAFRYWNENARDSMLVGSLERNADLKIGTLKASPWLRSAERQTLQMQSLAKYFDPAASRAEHDRLVDALLTLQMPDGGFTWYRYPNCESSSWATGTVLELLGELRHLGYQPDDSRLDDAIGRALQWYDNHYVTLSKKKEFRKATFPSFAYTRSLFPDAAMDKPARKLYDKTVKQMAKNWGKNHLSIAEKAFYAVTLNRSGKEKDARQIVESLRQFASTSPQLGMYWDQYRSPNWFTPSQISVTSTVLQAMAEVDPRNSELDEVRKWMLLAKRTTDWGGSSLAADAVYAILSCGNQWLERGEAPSITLNGAPVEFDRFDAFVGYCRRDIDARAGDSFHFGRLGSSPAWGGIYMQYSLPMSDVKQVAIDEISIRKDVRPYNTAGTPQAGAAIRVGDKVQVCLTITTNQALDYLMITDERASCFEPADITSGYRYQEGVGYYRETRDAATNIFINSLGKGVHVITYDAFATMPGTFSSGIATAQSQQAPEISAHSAGEVITVTE